MVARINDYSAQLHQAYQLKVGWDSRTGIERFRLVAASLQGTDTLVAGAKRGSKLYEALRVVQAVGSPPVYLFIIDEPLGSRLNQPTM